MYEKYDLEFPLSKDYLDLKKICSFMMAKKKGAGLEKIMNEIKRKDNRVIFKETKHRALPDAVNTAIVLKYLLEGGNEF